MSVPVIATSDTFEDWRQKANQVAADVGDIDNLSTPATSSLVDAINSVTAPGLIDRGGLRKVGADYGVDYDDDTISVDPDTGKLVIKNDGVSKTELNVDVAGNGLRQAQDESLEVRADESSITVTGGTVAVKTGGIQSSHLADAITINSGKTDSDFKVHGNAVENLIFVDASTAKVGIGTSTPAVALDVRSRTDALGLPSGTTGQRPSGQAGYIRYNSNTSVFEGFNGTSWITLSGSPQRIIVEERQDSGEYGSTTVGGSWNTRVLNSLTVDETGLASISSNRLTLPAGVWNVRVRAATFIAGGNQLRLRNITDNQTQLIKGSTKELLGVSNYNTALNGTQEVDVTLEGVFVVLGGPKVFEIQHYTTTSYPQNAGRPASSGSEEVYLSAVFEKVG